MPCLRNTTNALGTQHTDQRRRLNLQNVPISPLRDSTVLPEHAIYFMQTKDFLYHAIRKKIACSSSQTHRKANLKRQYSINIPGLLTAVHNRPVIMHGASFVVLHIWPLSLIAPLQHASCAQENGRDVHSSDRYMPMPHKHRCTPAWPNQFVDKLVRVSPPVLWTHTSFFGNITWPENE